MDFVDYNKYRWNIVCYLSQTTSCQSLTRTFLLASVMIKDMIKSLTYSILFGHFAATEWIVSKASLTILF